MDGWKCTRDFWFWGRTFACSLPEPWWSHKTCLCVCSRTRVCVRKWETGRSDNNIAPNLGSALFRLERHLFFSLCKWINIPCLIFAFFHHTNLVSIHTAPCWTHQIYETGGRNIFTCISADEKHMSRIDLDLQSIIFFKKRCHTLWKWFD